MQLAVPRSVWGRALFRVRHDHSAAAHPRYRHVRSRVAQHAAPSFDVSAAYLNLTVFRVLRVLGDKRPFGGTRERPIRTSSGAF